MSAKAIDIDITVITNGKVKHSSLHGFAFLDSGFLSGSMPRYSNLSIPEQVLLTAFTFTGCPIAARTQDKNLNPWVLTAGTYQGERILKSENFSIKSTLSSKGMDDHISMNLLMTCNGSLNSLAGIKQPFQESIYQMAPGLLHGQFDLSFFTENGNEVYACATSVYSLPISRETKPVWRNIIIMNSFNQETFQQTEQIDLFGNKEAADVDLKEKARICNK